LKGRNQQKLLPLQRKKCAETLILPKKRKQSAQNENKK
jgi:hypothetical protein